MSKTIMMISPYIIDVPLSVGGLLINHVEAGDKVYVVSMCYPGTPNRVVYPEARTPEGGLYGRFKTKETFEKEVASKEAEAVARTLGIEPIITWDYEANMEALFGMDVVDRTVEVLNQHEPDLVITYWPISNYSDFTGTSSALLRAMQERHLNKMPQVYFAETLAGKHTLCFTPNVYIDTTDAMEKKRNAAAQLWEGKNLDYFFNTHTLLMSRFRGRECGTEHAEAYVALHGGFGIEKTPMGGAPNARPVTMRRGGKCLTCWEFAEGIKPTDHPVDNDTARKAFHI